MSSQATVKKMNILTWDQFVENVHAWAEARGIYEESTEDDQLQGAFKELGELATAKTELEAKMELADVVVYTINAAKLAGDDVSAWFARLALGGIGRIATDLNLRFYVSAICECDAYAEFKGWDFMECCTLTWEKISKRDGEMRNGQFVKSEDL